MAVARYSETAERLMTPKPGIRKPGSDVVKSPFRNYLAYARGFLTQERILRGREFIERNAAIFDEIEMKSGVSRYVITAVIGVETFYGRNMGRYRVLDSLMTLSFDYTRRAAFFKEELAHFLEFCWRQEVQPVTVLGSFAGAIGYGQFMPSSLDRWGADGDKDRSYQQLSTRELEILQLIAKGYTNKEISEQVYLSVKTVEAHRSKIYQKLGLKSRADLVAYALRHKLLDV